MEITGTVQEIGEIIQVSENFRKREVIVEYADNPNYPEYIKFECHQDKVELDFDIVPGTQVEVGFNLRGRPWTNKEGKVTYFNTLVAWRWKILTSAPYVPPADLAGDPGADDDLPF